MDITERLGCIGRGQNLDLADLVCTDAIAVIRHLRDILKELDDYFDDEVDIIDGESGPLPNEAMHWQQRIREALGKGRRR
jgi:hypothetical protein